MLFLPDLEVLMSLSFWMLPVRNFSVLKPKRFYCSSPSLMMLCTVILSSPVRPEVQAT